MAPQGGQSMASGTTSLDVGSILAEARPQEEFRRSEWLVLFAFGVCTGLNAFLFAEFATVTDLVEKMFNVGASDVAWLYSGALLVVLLGMPVGVIMVVWWEAAALLLAVLANAACSWIRWMAVNKRNFSLLLVSACLPGVGAWTILPLPAQLSQQRFPSRRRSFTTSFGIMANYLGWFLASAVTPRIVVDESSMENFVFFQGVFSLFALAIFLVFYRPAMQHRAIQGLDTSVRDLGHAQETLTGEVSGQNVVARCRTKCHEYINFLFVVGAHPSLCLQILAYGVLGGVSFALPGCNDILLSSCVGLKTHATSAVNMAFIGTGVVGGLVLGFTCHSPHHYGKILKILFMICAFATVLLALLVELVQSHAAILHTHTQLMLSIILLLESVAGATSLGFIGIGIEAAALYPAGGTYVCFLIEAVIQLVGAILTQVPSREKRHGFSIIAAAAVAAGLLVLIGYRRYSPPTHALG